MYLELASGIWQLLVSSLLLLAGLLQLRLHITHLLGQASNLGLQVVTLCGCCLYSLFCLYILASLGLLQYQTRFDTL